MSGVLPGQRLVFRAINVLLIATTLAFGRLALGAAIDVANLRADARIVEHEAKELYRAFQEFQRRNHAYPGDWSGARFDVRTLDPLRRRGYYRGKIGLRLVGGQVDAYGSPDDRGPNQEFWLELTLASQPSTRFVIARSDDAPLGAGAWLDGVYMWRNGALDRL